MSTIGNNTNATAIVSPPSAPSFTANATAQSNQTWIGPAGLVSASRNTSAESMTTLLIFGPLSSCISLPDLSASPLPNDARQSGSAQQQALQEWFDALPRQRSCTSFSWKLVPDYTHHLDAMATFQGQLEQMFATLNGSVGGAGAGSTLANTTTTGSFFSSAPASSPTNDSALPQGLPLWIGVTLASVTIVHLLAFILHICSDLEALLPTLAARTPTSPTPETILPSHAPAMNQNSAKFLDQPQDEQASEPPKYTEPELAMSTRGASDLEATPALIRISRKLKRVVVPLLLLSALGMVGVAVVSNAKFAVGPVGSFSGSGDGAQVGGDGWNASSIPANVSSAAVPLSTSNSHSSTPQTHQAAPFAGPTSNATVSTPTDDQSENRPAFPAATATPSRTRLVRRQTNFFPVASPSIATSSEVSPLPLPTTSFPWAAPTPTSSSTSSSAPNASLFPPISSSTPSPSSTSTSAAQPTPSSSTTAAAAPNTSSTAPSPFVLQRGDSTHRLWWLVILDLLLWFIQRRRTRSQTALDKARSMVIDQLSAIRQAQHLQGKVVGQRNGASM